MKDISAMYKNKLGTRNYSILEDVFGLASPSTCDMHVKENRTEVEVWGKL